MTTTFIVCLLLIAAYAGILIALTQWAAHSKRYGQYRIRTPESYRIPLKKRIINIGGNTVLAVIIYTSVLTLFHGYLFSDEPVSGLTVFGQVLGVLLFYDFFYYFMHRTLHHRKLMKWVHGVHHKARFPSAVESLYLHPLEQLAGLSLLMGSTAILGPVSTTAFLLIVFVHTTANILVHTNMVFPHPACKLANYWAQRHDVHHGKHLNRNYASIFPFWDMMFDTYA
jgi:sterol desaturase/sphingolipid hydroxylase (fatty acid hydroxylase superfamily)